MTASGPDSARVSGWKRSRLDIAYVLWIVTFAGLLVGIVLTWNAPIEPVKGEGVWWVAYKVVLFCSLASALPLLLILGATARGQLVPVFAAGGFALNIWFVAGCVAADWIDHRYGEDIPQWTVVTVERKESIMGRRSLSRSSGYVMHAKTVSGVALRIYPVRWEFDAVQHGEKLRVAMHRGFFGRSWGSAWERSSLADR